MVDGTRREVRHGDDGDPFYEVSFSVNETAAALCKSQLTFKKWIREGIVPEPVYQDSRYGYAQYLQWEVEALVKAVGDHFDYFDYLRVTHEETISAIWAEVFSVRAERGRFHARDKEK